MAEQPGSKIHPPPPISTPRLAPWEHVEELVKRLDRLIALLEAAAPPAPPPEWAGWEPITSRLDEIKNQLKTLEISVPTWEAAEPKEIYRKSIRTTGTFNSEQVDWKKGKRLILKVNNTLNQAVKIQPTGNIIDAIDNSVDINGLLDCPAHGYISIGLAWDDWHPYIWAKIIVATAPTSGEIKIGAVIQE